MQIKPLFFHLLIPSLLIVLLVFGSSHVAADSDIFGKIKPPTGGFGTNPADDLGTLIGVGIRTTFIIAGITCLFFMLWGAISWITSSGEQEKLQKAQQRIRNAVIGMIMVVLMFGLFIVIFGIVLNNKIIDTRNGFRFIIPSVRPGDCPDPLPGQPPVC